jgi:ATP/maltotriose-dependent transcriptional regulator MalT
VAALAARTEGWAVGLQLATMSLRGHRDPAAFVASFTGSHRYVLDFLTEEVLARLTEDDQVANAMVDSNLAQVDWLAGRLPQVEQNAPRPSPPTGPPAHPSRPATSTTSWPRSNTD